MRDEPPELSESGRNISPALDHIVRHCLEKDRDHRFQSARDIVFALSEASLPAVTSGVGVGVLARPGISKRSPVFLVATCALVLLGVVATILLQRRPPATAKTPPAAIGPSIAVLPFTNLSSDKDQEYFSDGLSEELMGLLTKVKELHVAGRMASFAFKGKTEELASIGQKLHVATVLEGSVRRSGDQLRVSTQLVNVADGYQIWAETYGRRVTDVFAVQDEIAGAVVTALKVKLLPQERLASSHRTTNMEAYNRYLMGRQFFARHDLEGYSQAAIAYEGALALDPNYAAAHAALAVTLMGVVDFAKSRAEQADAQRKALAAAEKAVELDPTLPEGYSARANIRSYIGRDWAGAEEDFQRALSLDPSDPMTHAGYGRLLARLGQLPEAIAECRKATELDPLFVRGWVWLGSYLNSIGQLPEARKALTRVLEISPKSEYGRYYLAVTEILAGNSTVALGVVGTPTTSLRRTIVALAEHDLGHAKEAQQALDDLIAQHRLTAPYRVAVVYAWRGEKDRAFEWLDRAYEQSDTGLPTLVFDPLVAKLRDDPRFAAMLKKLNLPVGK